MFSSVCVFTDADGWKQIPILQNFNNTNCDDDVKSELIESCVKIKEPETK